MTYALFAVDFKAQVDDLTLRVVLCDSSTACLITQMVTPSAHTAMFPGTLQGRAVILIRKRREPSTDPCGIPFRTREGSESNGQVLIVKDRLVRKLWSRVND